MTPLIQLLRPKHWLKNLFVFLPLIFSGELTDFIKLAKGLGIFAAFSLMASAIYAFNDVMDADFDRRHDQKKNRPIAAGIISQKDALAIALVLFVLSLVLSSFISARLARILLLYAGMNVLYSLKLKNFVILDVMIISIGFVLRMLSGATISSFPPSHWILLLTFFLSLFLGFAKRRTELVYSARHSLHQRQVLTQYSPRFLDQILSTTMAVTILCYGIYTTSDYVQQKFHTDRLIYTTPFVIFGIFYYFQQVLLARKGEDPTEILTRDRPTLLNLLLWVLSCIFIIYFRK